MQAYNNGGIFLWGIKYGGIKSWGHILTGRNFNVKRYNFKLSTPLTILISRGTTLSKLCCMVCSQSE